MTKIYFRDFLKKLVDAGIPTFDISFQSPDLMHQYHIKDVKKALQCERIGVHKDRKNASFPWYKHGSNIHDYFYVVRLDTRVVGTGLFRRSIVNVHLRRY